MSMHGSATAPEETPHETETTTIPISDALRRRAQSVINDSRTDPQWRSILRYALEVDDPWLADIVRRADAGERIIDTVDFSLEPQFNEDDSHEEKVEALAGIISRAGHESAAALFVLMGTLENSRDPKLFANAVKHFAFTHCSMSNLYGMVDAQLSHSRQQTTIKSHLARGISHATAQRHSETAAKTRQRFAPLRLCVRNLGSDLVNDGSSNVPDEMRLICLRFYEFFTRDGYNAIPHKIGPRGLYDETLRGNDLLVPNGLRSEGAVSKSRARLSHLR